MWAGSTQPITKPLVRKGGQEDLQKASGEAQVGTAGFKASLEARCSDKFAPLDRGMAVLKSGCRSWTESDSCSPGCNWIARPKLREQRKVAIAREHGLGAVCNT